MIGAGLALLTAAAPAQVVLRGESRSLDAPVLRVSEQGVALGGTPEQVLPWDRVKLVLGEHAPAAQQYEDLALDAWRARTRLERSDYDLACPLFESLFERVRDHPGPTLAGVAEGLLRCRMRRGDSAGAVEAWLALRASGAAGRAGAMVDADTGLVPTLPPLWPPDADFRAVVDSLDRLAGLDAMAALYADAARAQSGTPVVPVPLESVPTEHGAWLVTTIVRAISASPEARSQARQSLAEVVDGAPGTWREAWARAAIGRSLLIESEPEAHDEAVAQLVHLPARFGASHPRLARAALLLLAREMGARGDARSAATLATLADDPSLAEPAPTPTPEAE